MTDDAGSGAGGPAVTDGTVADDTPARSAATDAWAGLADRFGLRTRTLQAIAAVVAVGLLARLVGLGWRIAHFDEGRVAYWALRYARTGHFEYRFIIHGPFVQHVDRWLFVLLGPNDYVARLPVALIGGLLPLAAILYRDHLRDEELVALALFLALNPLLLYYSRFMRSDVLVAAFMFTAFGFLLRLLSTRDVRYLHAVTLFVALGFASKENFIIYIITWLGAGAVVLEYELYRPREHASGIAVVRGHLDRARTALQDRRDDLRPIAARYGGHLAATVGLFALLTLFFYAPRAGAAGGPGLWKPLTFPAVLGETGHDLARGFGYWFGGAADPGCRKETLSAGYACYLGYMLNTLRKFAGPLVVFAVGGFLIERYGRERSRTLVMVGSYWGVASVLGYPLGTDIWGAWVVVHAVVPLTIPAAVGFGAVVRQAGEALADDDALAVAVLVVLLVPAVGGMILVGAESSFVDPQTRDSNSDMVQYAQPSGGMRPGLAAMNEAIDGDGGDGSVDVLYYGDRFWLHDESAVALPPPADPNPEYTTGGWFNRLPLPWYTEAFGAETASVKNASALERALAERPPVIVADARVADDVSARVDGYRTYEYDLRANIRGPNPGTSVVIFVDESRL